MPNFQDDNRSRSTGRETSRWNPERLAADEGGAVLVLCFVAILILLLLSWTMFDALWVSRDKIEVQASADVAAFSQASVKSRSMNMMAFTNVGKRSVVGVHAVYESMFISYLEWTLARVEECIARLPQCDMEVARENRELFYEEFENDYEAYEANRNYYVADVRALDNYQNYIVAVTPWWGWSEAVTRAQRNGATLATSFPPPWGTADTTVPEMVTPVTSAVGGSSFNFASDTDGLPVRRGDFFDAMVDRGMIDNDAWRNGEHAHNVSTHRNNSSLGAASSAVVNRGASFSASGTMTRGLQKTSNAMRIGVGTKSYAAAWEINHYDNEAKWLLESSNILMVYRHDPEYFNDLRDKFNMPEDEFDEDTTSLEGRLYRPRGFWGLARSEISFQGDGMPNMWEPAWTARMRPVSLPGEFSDAGYDFNGLYHTSLEHLMLSGIIHGNITGDGPEFLDDLIYLEKVTRGMGQSTIGGVGR